MNEVDNVNNKLKCMHELHVLVIHQPQVAANVVCCRMKLHTFHLHADLDVKFFLQALNILNVGWGNMCHCDGVAKV
jgi:hypothetical protein